MSTNGQERNEVLNIMELLTKQKIFCLNSQKKTVIDMELKELGFFHIVGRIFEKRLIVTVLYMVCIHTMDC